MGRKQFSRAVEKAIFKRAKGLCQVCANPTEFDYGEIDHILSKCKGGSDGPENLQWACHRCNKLKGSNLTNEKVRELLSLPVEFQEIMKLKAKEKAVEKSPANPHEFSLPSLSQEGLDVSEINNCIANLQESFQSETVIPEVCNKIIPVKEVEEDFVNIGFHYRFPRQWFMPSEVTQQAYSNVHMFRQFGRSITLAELRYLAGRISENREVQRIEVDLSPKGILQAVNLMKSKGFNPNIFTVPIETWIKMHLWTGDARFEYSNLPPKPLLDATLTLNEVKLKGISPIGTFPQEPLLLDSNAISWKVKKQPTGALYVVLGNNQLYPLKYIELLAGTTAKCEITKEGVSILKFQK